MTDEKLIEDLARAAYEIAPFLAEDSVRPKAWDELEPPFQETHRKRARAQLAVARPAIEADMRDARDTVLLREMDELRAALATAQAEKEQLRERCAAIACCAAVKKAIRALPLAGVASKGESE